MMQINQLQTILNSTVQGHAGNRFQRSAPPTAANRS